MLTHRWIYVSAQGHCFMTEWESSLQEIALYENSDTNSVTGRLVLYIAEHLIIEILF